MNKNISSIQYNSLNLPSSITYQNGNMASYVYSAAGGKLSVSYQTGTGNTSTQYCGNIIYDDNNLSQLHIDGGYITFSGTTPQYHYFLRDHLGSNRVVVNESGTAEQINHYYPFGGLMGNSTNGDVQRFKYNGKELDCTHGLDWYDYGARHFDAAIGCWHTTDPLCEKYYSLSPYNYCGNNPVNVIDIKGDSICVLNYGYGLNQHLAMLIQNDQGKWQYYSVNGNNVYLFGVFSGGRPFDDIAVGSWDSPEAFMTSTYNKKGDKDDLSINHYGFTEGFVIASTPEQDKKMRITFSSISQNEEYDILENNCATAVTRTMEAAGLRTYDETKILTRNVRWTQCGAFPVQENKTVAPKSIIPSKAFMSIQICNPQGKYIHK